MINNTRFNSGQYSSRPSGTRSLGAEYVDYGPNEVANAYAVSDALSPVITGALAQNLPKSITNFQRFSGVPLDGSGSFDYDATSGGSEPSNGEWCCIYATGLPSANAVDLSASYDSGNSFISLGNTNFYDAYGNNIGTGSFTINPDYPVWFRLSTRLIRFTLQGNNPGNFSDFQVFTSDNPGFDQNATIENTLNNINNSLNGSVTNASFLFNSTTVSVGAGATSPSAFFFNLSSSGGLISIDFDSSSLVVGMRFYIEYTISGGNSEFQMISWSQPDTETGQYIITQPTIYTATLPNLAGNATYQFRVVNLSGSPVSFNAKSYYWNMQKNLSKPSRSFYTNYLQIAATSTSATVVLPRSMWWKTPKTIKFLVVRGATATSETLSTTFSLVLQNEFNISDSPIATNTVVSELDFGPNEVQGAFSLGGDHPYLSAITRLVFNRTTASSTMTIKYSIEY